MSLWYEVKLTFYLQQGQWPFPENDVSETTERKIDGEGDDADDLRSDEESDQDDIFVNTNRPEIEQSDSEDSSTDDDEKK